jgi:hypothetical protein
VQRAAIAIAAAVCLACGLLAAAASGAPSGAPPARAPRTATTASTLPAQIAFGSGSRRIPTSFFGLSLEYKELRTYVKSGALFRRMLSIVRPRDGGPMLLRIGGKSADHVWWGTTEKPPQWVTTIGEQWLSRLSGLVSRADLKVVLDLNLAVHSPTMAARFAKAAVQALPRSSVAGFEVGNEPDLYWRQPWLEKQRIASTSSDVPRRWTGNYSPIDYARDYEAYARAVMTAAPGIPLGGPEIISSKADWLTVLAGLGRLEPGFLSIHRYASSTCLPPSSSHYPTIPLMLANASSAGVASSTEGAVQFAHANHTQLRLTEINSISCGGNSGVANSFATALWAPDVLFELLNAGVDGVNWHIRPSTLNAPFNLDQGKLVPLPELYGLAMFAQMTRGPARLLDTTVSASAGLDLKAWTVRRGATTSVLLINKGRRDAHVTVPATGGGHGAAIVRRLQAPRIGSTTGLRFAGRRIGTDGLWHGQEKDEPVTARGGSYPVTVPAYSAAMVTLGG